MLCFELHVVISFRFTVEHQMLLQALKISSSNKSKTKIYISVLSTKTGMERKLDVRRLQWHH